MKKQKFMKLSAFTSEPALENAFAAPGSHNGEISVVFRGKNVSIHGWDGSAWTTIYTWNSLDKQFTFENTYQNYFLKSLTGQEESMGVSFFSVDNYQGSTPLMAGIQRDVKLYDIEEVPVYTASDVNKFLTVMSDGSLRWLGLSESYIVELIGGGGDAGNAAGLEDNVSLQLFGGATVDGGVLNAPNAGDYATLPHAAEYEIAEAKTFSMWFKTSDLTALDFDDNYTLMSKWRHSDRSGYVLSIGKGVDSRNTVQNYMNNNGWGTNGYVRFIACNSASTHSLDSSTFYKLNKNVEDNQWHHIVFQIDNVAVGVQPITRVFLDGVLLSESVGSRNSGSTLQLPAANGWLTDRFYVEQSTPTIPLNIAGHSYSPGFRTFRGSLDGVNINSGIMTDSEISDLFNAGRVTPEQPASQGSGTDGGIIPHVLAHPDTTIVGSSTPVFENNILTFDGLSYVIHGDITEYVYSDVTTINFWMNTTTKNKFKIFNIGVASSGNAHVFHYDNGQLVWIKPQGPNHIFNGTTYHNSGWHMVTLVWDNVTGSANLYMDGQLIGTKTWAPVADPYGVGDDNYGLALGNGTGVGSFRPQTEWMVGSMTKLEITNDIWDATQVSSKFAEGSGVS